MSSVPATDSVKDVEENEAKQIEPALFILDSAEEAEMSVVSEPREADESDHEDVSKSKQETLCGGIVLSCLSQ